MDMIRWLATNKVVMAVWGLGFLAMLLSLIFGGGDKAGQSAAVAEAPAVDIATKPAVKVKTVAEAAKSEVKVVAATATATTAAVVSAVQGAVDIKAEAVEKVSTEGEVETVEAKVTDASGDPKGSVEKEASVDESKDNLADLADKSSDDLLMMAREAYWDNGLDKAAGLYAELIAREPGVIEHKGELGNVLWRQGYPKKAAELYANISEPMIAEGNGERVSNMVGFIGLFFPERATNIRKLLDAE